MLVLTLRLWAPMKTQLIQETKLTNQVAKLANKKYNLCSLGSTHTKIGTIQR